MQGVVEVKVGSAPIVDPGARRAKLYGNLDVRAIARSPVHLTRETTVSLFQRLGLLPAMDHMCKMLEKALTAPEATWQREALERLQILRGGHSVQPASFVTREISCPVCGLYFTGLQAMKIHHTKMHGPTSGQTKVSAVQARGQLNVYEHSLDGMPTCKHCLQKFSRWPNFLSHLLQSCPQLHGGNPQRETGTNNETTGTPQTIPCTESSAEKLQGQTCRASAVDAAAQRSAAGCILEPFQRRQPVIELIGTARWKEVLDLPAMCSDLAHHCVVCMQWVAASPAGMKNHLKRAHPQEWQHVADASALSLTLTEGKHPPCKACGKSPAPATPTQVSQSFPALYAQEVVWHDLSGQWPSQPRRT